MSKNYIALSGAIIGILTFLSAIAITLFDFGSYNENIKGRIFNTNTQKIKVIRYVEDAPTPLELQKKIILDSVNNAHAIKSRIERDKRGIIRDSISLLNADQIYQIKELLKELKE